MFCSNYKKPIIDSIKNWVTLHFICVIETSVESRKLDIGWVLFLLFYEPRHNRGSIKSAGEKEQKIVFIKKKNRFRLLHSVALKGGKKIIHLFIFSPIFPFVMVGIIIIFLITGVSKSKFDDLINGIVISKFGFNLPQCSEVRLQMSSGLH